MDDASKRNRDEICLDLTCNHCERSDFQSRNKLFKHIKECLSKRDQSNSPPVEESLQNLLKFHNDVYIYIVGGRLRGRTLKSAERFSLKKNSWELIPQLIENRGSHGAVAIGQYIYAIGGGGLHSNLSTCEKFSIESQAWSMIATMTTFRHALTVVAYKSNAIYALGGWYDGKTCSGETECYHIDSDKWEQLAGMNVPRRLLGATVLQDRIYSFGGNVDDGVWYTNVVEVYDVAADKWEIATSLPVAGSTSCVTVNDEEIYVFLHGKGVYKFIPNFLNPMDSTYEWIGSLPIADWFCFDVSCISTVVFLNGGVTNGQWLDCMYAFDVKSRTWKEMPPMLRQRRRCAAAVVHIPEQDIITSTTIVNK